MPDTTPQTHIRTCPLCEATCGLRLKTEGDRVIAVQGDPEDVLSRGFLCTKGMAIGDLHHDPDRLKQPMIRKPGEHEFRPASWTEAFQFAHEHLTSIIERHGRRSLGIYLGNPTTHKPALNLYAPYLIRAMRTHHIYSASTVDQIPKQLSSGLMFGSGTAVPVPDIDRTEYILLLGANPIVSNGSLWTAPDVPGRLRALKERGGKLVVVDPRRTETAARADEHLSIIPASDAFFLAAIVQTILQEKLENPGRLSEHMMGLDAIRRAVVDFSPERVSTRTGIDAETIRRIARELCKTKSVVYGRIGTCTQEFGTIASWLIDVINILTGQLDAEGGAMFTRPVAAVTHTKPRTGKETGVRVHRRHSRVRGLPQVFGEFPVSCLAEEITTPGEGQIRALFTVAGNPAVSTPDSGALNHALGDLEFMISVDVYLNDTTRHANLILPGPSPLEDIHFDWVFGNFMVRNTANFSPATFPKPEQALYEWEILLRLGGILNGSGPEADLAELDHNHLKQMIPLFGYRPENLAPEDAIGKLKEQGGPARLIEYLVRSGPYGDHFGEEDGVDMDALRENPHGIDFGPLKPSIPEVLRTASGKIEMAPEAIMQDIPRLREALDTEPPELVLIGRRHIKSNNSWMHNIERLAKGKERDALWMHPDDASRHGVANGDTTRIASRTGELEVQVKVTEDIRPGVVSLPHGWSKLKSKDQRVAAQYPGVNSNILTDPDLYDRPSGNAVLDGIPVQVVAKVAAAT